MPGCPEHTYGQERQQYRCGTLFIDHAASKVFNFCQFSTNAYGTVSSKHKLKELARYEGFNIKSYHLDSGIFAGNEFMNDCETLKQTIDYSGVGAQHQNGVAERNIKTVASWT